MEGNDDMFFKNQVFQNEDEVKKFLDNYNRKNFSDFVIKTNNKRSLIALCKYGYNRPSESKGIRKNLHYNFVDLISFHDSEFLNCIYFPIAKVF